METRREQDDCLLLVTWLAMILECFFIVTKLDGTSKSSAYELECKLKNQLSKSDIRHL